MTESIEEQPELRDRLSALATNLWWSWSFELDAVFRSVDVGLWRAVNHNPTAFLADIDPENLAAAAKDGRVLSRVTHAERSLSQYLAGADAWAVDRASALRSRPVAYFSPEFCIHESLPIYSGGLGVLAGDHLKSCSDLGIPTYGITLLYRHGYFTQQISPEGRQTEVYRDLDTDRVAIEPILEDGQPVYVEIPIDHTSIVVRLWRARVGRCDLILLDVDEKTAERFPHASRLYGGQQETRIVQELMLGVGGYKALRRLGVTPGVMHMNEGHSAFAGLEAIAQTMEATGQDFVSAQQEVVESTIFTTHTPVEAGHDRFEPNALLEFMRPLQDRLTLSDKDFLGLGRVDPENSRETFCMSVLAMKLARRTNAVSGLHGRVSRKMWHCLWPERRVNDVPIGHITNGVHVDGWLAYEFELLYRDVFGADWRARMCDRKMWRAIQSLDDELLWQTKRALKTRLLGFLDRRLERRWNRFGNGEENPPQLDIDVLTIGVARRFASYKRGTLFFSDFERAKKILTNPERPVQIIYAGKAHPADEPGKELIRQLVEIGRDPELRTNVIVLEDYDRNVSRHLLEGCDLWLNSPRRPLEACGTSGMKAVFNATLNCSTLDGWWDEAYDGCNGFAFGEGRTHVDVEVHDDNDVKSLYEVLENHVVPTFYDRDERGLPIGWLGHIKHALRSLGWRYNSDRMVRDYATYGYLPARNAVTSDFR
jgi:starch phosphorylase